jgi:hypothetical protein
MKFFIAVVFFCVGDDCAFFKSDVNYYSIEDCQRKVASVIKELDSNGIKNEGVCLPIKMDQV